MPVREHINGVWQLAGLHLKMLGRAHGGSSVSDSREDGDKTLDDQLADLKKRLSAANIGRRFAERAWEDQQKILEQRVAMQVEGEASAAGSGCGARPDPRAGRAHPRAGLAHLGSGSISRSVDSLATFLNESGRWLKDQEEIFGDIDLGPSPYVSGLTDSPETAEQQARGRIAMTDPGSINRTPRHSPVGIIVTVILCLGIIGLGGWLYMRSSSRRRHRRPSRRSSRLRRRRRGDDLKRRCADARRAFSRQPADRGGRRLCAEEQCGRDRHLGIRRYGGLIVANGGLAPNPDSFFAKEYGFQVKLSVSEEETWGKLNNGKFAASATTADVLAVLGRRSTLSCRRRSASPAART